MILFSQKYIFNKILSTFSSFAQCNLPVCTKLCRKPACSVTTNAHFYHFSCSEAFYALKITVFALNFSPMFFLPCFFTKNFSAIPNTFAYTHPFTDTDTQIQTLNDIFQVLVDNLLKSLISFYNLIILLGSESTKNQDLLGK